MRQANIEAISKEDLVRKGIPELVVSRHGFAIFVEEELMENALKVISEYFNGSHASVGSDQAQPWKWETCSEFIEPHFTA